MNELLKDVVRDRIHTPLQAIGLCYRSERPESENIYAYLIGNGCIYWRYSNPEPILVYLGDRYPERTPELMVREEVARLLADGVEYAFRHVVRGTQ